MSEENNQEKQKPFDSSQGKQDLLPLDVGERVMTWRVTGSERIRRHCFIRPAERLEVVKEFYRLLTAKPGEDSIKSVEMRVNAAQTYLYQELCVRAEGYVLPGGQQLTELENWRGKVMPRDRQFACSLLVNSQGDVDDELPDIDPEFDIVLLKAYWSADPKTPGGMHQHLGLVHKFDPLTEEERIDLYRQLDRSFEVRGARESKTVRPCRQLVLLAWYDKKIAAVESYSVAGRAVSGREEIVAWMDPFHKVAAMEVWQAPIPNAELVEQSEEEA